ncbi:hypothetical protein XENTR_v10006283 [Xenopus tropicalis]|nr:hypothetical protein XENTR_v10006283 [Xenopus tropicalis]
MSLCMARFTFFLDFSMPWGEMAPRQSPLCMMSDHATPPPFFRLLPLLGPSSSSLSMQGSLLTPSVHYNQVNKTELQNCLAQPTSELLPFHTSQSLPCNPHVFLR